MQPTISTLPLLQMASGDWLTLQVYTFTGTRPGKKVYIQSNLHGAEFAGNAVIHQLIENLQALEATALTGEIVLVPVCNPLGVNQRSHHFASGRYNPYDGLDWNRIFWDYEKAGDDLEAFAKSQLDQPPDVVMRHYRRRIQEKFEQQRARQNRSTSIPVNHWFRNALQSLCLDADYVIDLHSSTNQGLDYLYYFRDRAKSAKAFGLDFYVLLDAYDGDAFDEAFIKPWLALEKQFARLGRSLQFDIEAWTLEIGSGMQLNPSSVDKALQGVKRYLSQKQILSFSEDLAVINLPGFYTRQSQMQRYHAPAGGFIQSRVTEGTVIKAGDALYQLLTFPKSQQSTPDLKEIYAAQDGLVYDISISHAVNQGEYVLSTLVPDAD